MTQARLALGVRAEKAALEHLCRNRHEILATNFRSRAGEIDIVSRQGGTIVFVEVRSRSHREFGSGLESVGIRKRRRLCRAAEAFLLSRDLRNVACRFDVIGVEWRDGDPRIDHVENAFECS